VEVLTADFLLKELSIFGMACLQQSTFHLYPALRALSDVLTFQNLENVFDATKLFLAVFTLYSLLLIWLVLN